MKARFIKMALALTTLCCAMEVSGRQHYVSVGLSKIFARKFTESPSEDISMPVYIDGAVKNYIIPSIAIGSELNKHLSVELMGTYRRFSYRGEETWFVHTQTINSYAMFCSLLAHTAPSSSKIRPYLTAGVGYVGNVPNKLSSYDKTNKTTEEFDATGKYVQTMAYQLGLGIKVRTNKNLIVDFLYRYTTCGKVENGDGIDAQRLPVLAASQNIKGHQIGASLIWLI